MADIILTEADTKRFWLKTRWNPTTGCLEWTAGKSHFGYGKYHIKRVGFATHRIAWVLAHGPIPDGLCVCHRCDNPPCLNEDHLFLGTMADNHADMRAKGRGKGQGVTHCPKGHLLAGDNLMKAGRRKTLCRACWGPYQAAWREAHKAERPSYNKAYYAAHRDEILTQKAAYYARVKGRNPAA